MDLLICCVLWLVFTLFCVMALSFNSGGRRKHLPPGPRPYPVIGNLLELGGKPHKSLAKLAKTHGPIMSLRLGLVTTVVVSSPSTAKAILKEHDSLSCDRKVPESILSQPYRHHEFSLVWLPVSTLWRIRNSMPVKTFGARKSEMIDTKHIKHLFADLLIAGNDTASITMEWAMAELLHNPEALSKVKLELEQTVGKGNPIEESDITRLPYLQAVIKETFRLHPTVPLLVPRKVSEDIEIEGFVVPKGAQVFVNVWAIGRDESIWDNPHSFMPERFLGSDVEFKGQHFELIPFGAGRRICPGLPLAIRMLYLMLGSLINSFDWKLENEDMDMEEKFGLTIKKAQPLRTIPIAI
ncbi:hypothetical protein CUMW_247260 [Citrus unshiu]|uniref:Cytochrome P450 n=1 Tax=Citrus unshiu TaxID=55188 RepID=A0A2H5QNQ6_CITUN|nr:hypothetical protein CUMW_247260 [Citrus unshiu]